MENSNEEEQQANEEEYADISTRLFSGALGALFCTSGVLVAGAALSGLKTALTGVAEETTERNALGPNKHEYVEVGIFKRGLSLITSGALGSEAITCLTIGLTATDMAAHGRFRLTNFLTKSSDELLNPEDYEDLQDNTPDIDEIMEGDEEEFASIDLLDLNIDDDIIEYLAVEGFETAADLPEINEAGLVAKTELDADEAKQLTKAVVTSE